MNNPTDVAVLGGGPAGTGVAIRLAMAGFNITLLEKNVGRQHKLCGEFMSPEVVEGFKEIGVLETIMNAGAVPIDRLRLTERSGKEFCVALPATAIGLSRATLDEILLDRAEAVGVHVVRGIRVDGVDGDAERGFRITTDKSDPIEARFVVGAFGKRSSLDRVMNRSHLAIKSPWIGFKSHFEGGDLGDTIEVHLFERGYCGMSMVEDGQTNVCWLMHADDLKRSGGKPDDAVSSVLASNPVLADRIDTMHRTFERYLSVGQLLFRPRGCFDRDVALVGDAAGMISPLCGDGIAMAVESARIISPLLAEVLSREKSFDSFRNSYTRSWTRTFSTRMLVGRTLQRVLMAERGASISVGLANNIPLLGTALIRATRGKLTERQHVLVDP